MSDQTTMGRGESEQAPEVEPEPGWRKVPELLPLIASSTFVSGDPGGKRLRIAYFQREKDGALVGRVWFGPLAEGPPAHAHGGSVAAVLDEAMGAAAWITGHLVLAANISVSFRQMLPLGTDARLEAWIERVEGKKVHAQGRLTGDNGELYGESTGLYVLLDAETVERMKAIWQKRHETDVA